MATTYWGRFTRPVRPRLGASFGGGGLGGSYDEAYGAARTANLQRYQEILAGYRQRYEDALAQLGSVGAGEEALISRRARERRATAGQWAAERGLYGTTVRTGKEAEADEIAGQERLDLSDRLARLRLGVMSGLSGDTLQFMERRTDAYPDTATYLALLQQLGMAQGQMPRRGLYG